MPMNKKATLLLLEYMKRTIEQMPNDVKINAFFSTGAELGLFWIAAFMMLQGS